MSARLKCEGCGGSVEYDAKEQAAACLFCGLHALVLADPNAEIPFDPQRYVPMQLDQSAADAAFRSWARASWWRPKALRAVAVQANAIYLPAWHFTCDIDTHWAGLRAAATASGKAPKTGQASARMAQVVPASGGLQPAELFALWPYDTDRARPFDGSASPHELPAKSRHRAAGEVHAQLQARHREVIANTHGLSRCNVMSEVRDVDAHTVLLPVYVGVFRFRDRPWRFLINGQSGEVFGKAPVDRVKVLIVVGLALLAALIAAWFSSR